MIKYNILTSFGVYDIEDSESGTYSKSLDLVEEQNNTLSEFGFENDCETAYVIHFSNYCDCELMTIDEAIQCLALKDGAGLVKFENENIGFVGYCNGFSIDKNRFEIIRKPTEQDIYNCENSIPILI